MRFERRIFECYNLSTLDIIVIINNECRTFHVNKVGSVLSLEVAELKNVRYNRKSESSSPQIVEI